MLIDFRFQLNAQYFISIVMLLYMFQAHLCPSSGGPLHIYNIWFYVSLKIPCFLRFLLQTPLLTFRCTADVATSVVQRKVSSGVWSKKRKKHGILRLT